MEFTSSLHKMYSATLTLKRIYAKQICIIVDLIGEQMKIGKLSFAVVCGDILDVVNVFYYHLT